MQTVNVLLQRNMRREMFSNKDLKNLILPLFVEQFLLMLVKVALSSMVALFGLWLGWGVIGVAIGMSIDLVFRGIIFIWRLKSQKWTHFQLI